jgi:hypothetical protein
MSTPTPAPIPAPWVLIDDLAVEHTTRLLERLVAWLEGPASPAITQCTRALSLGETNDPITVASWADALATRLRRCAEQSRLDPAELTD